MSALRTLTILLVGLLASMAGSLSAQPATYTDLGVVADTTATYATPDLTDSSQAVVTGEVVWYRFVVPSDATDAAGTFLDIDTDGTSLSNNDSVIGIYNNAGDRIASDDDDGSGTLSALSFGQTSPTRGPIGSGVAGNGRDGGLVGGVYWLAFGAYNTTFGSTLWNATSLSSATGTATVNFRTNLPTPPTDDVGVLSIDAPVTAPMLTATETISITIQNFGSNAQSNIPVSYTINGGTPVNETVAGPIAAFTSGTYSFTATVDLSSAGTTYTIVVTTALTADSNSSNDSETLPVRHIPTYDSFPYNEDFEGASSADWLTSGTAGIWELGTPSNVGPATASSGSNCWGTVIDGNYNVDNASTFLDSPPFDLTSASRPVFSFHHHVHSDAVGTSGYDGGTLQISVNGSTFISLSNTDPGFLQNPPNYATLGSTGDSGWANNPTGSGWAEVQIDLLNLTSATVTAGDTVSFRFWFGSDISFSSLPGWYIDDVTLVDLPDDDVGVTELLAPVSAPGLTATESVQVALYNFGGQSQTNIPVSVTINGGAPITETYTGTLPSFGTDTFTFTATFDFSATGTDYTVVAGTSLTGDADNTNDSTTTVVRNPSMVSSFPYTEDFEGATSVDWLVSGSTTSWELGTPANTVINSASSGTNSWITNASANYADNENGAVLSPGFDMSSLTSDPWISLSIWWEAESSYDGAVLQSSIDNGASWQNIGADGDPHNWFNDGTITGLSAGSGQQEGWTGQNASGSGGWVTAMHELTGLAGQSFVRLRIVFGSDSSATGNGFAFDDVFVGTLAEINVTHGANNAPHRGTIDIGNINTVTGGSATFEIENLGDLDLTLDGTAPDYVVVAGVNNINNVNVSTQPGTPVAAGSSESFVVDIAPNMNGGFEFTVTIANGDITRTVLASGTDGEMVSGTDTFISASANFVASDVGTVIVISGSASNDGEYVIDTVISATEVVLTTTPADETGLTWSHEGTEDPYTFTVTGTASGANNAAEADPEAGSSFAGPTNGPLTQTVAPGATLANATIELTDPESDDITVTAITPPGTVPTGITAPTIPGTPGHPVTLTWTGTVDASNPPGDYTWVVEFEDAINGSTETCDVTITIEDVAPAHTIQDASGGDGSTGTPYTASFAENDTGATSVDLATVSDDNTGQTVTIDSSVTPNPDQTSGPTGGTGFQFTLSGGSLTVAPAGTLDAVDVGTQVFDVTITDGTNQVVITVSIDVFGNSGAISFDQTTLPDGTVNSAYTTTLTVTGATAPNTFSVISGSLPVGFSLNGVTGEISGTPTIAATSNFTIRVVDSTSDSEEQAFSIVITTASSSDSDDDDDGCSTSTNQNSWLVLVGLLSLIALATRIRKSNQ